MFRTPTCNHWRVAASASLIPYGLVVTGLGSAMDSTNSQQFHMQTFCQSHHKNGVHSNAILLFRNSIFSIVFPFISIMSNVFCLGLFHSWLCSQAHLTYYFISCIISQKTINFSPLHFSIQLRSIAGSIFL